MGEGELNEESEASDEEPTPPETAESKDMKRRLDKMYAMITELDKTTLL